MPYVLLLTTIDSEAAARQLANRAVSQSLAACVQIVPVESVYQWQGKLESAREYRCEMKTRADRVEQLRELIQEQHTYEVPEVIEMDLRNLSSAYRAWVDEQLGI